MEYRHKYRDVTELQPLAVPLAELLSCPSLVQIGVAAYPPLSAEGRRSPVQSEGGCNTRQADAGSGLGIG